MSLSTLTPRIVADGVLYFAINELRWLPGSRFHNSDPERNTIIDHIGKAVTLFGLLQQRKVRQRLKELKPQLMRSMCSFACFVFNFTENFFRQESEVDQYFLVKILTFCGVLSELALFCYKNGRPLFMVICVDLVKHILSTKLGNVCSSGAWQKLHSMSCSFAFFYTNMFKHYNGQEN